MRGHLGVAIGKAVGGCTSCWSLCSSLRAASLASVPEGPSCLTGVSSSQGAAPHPPPWGFFQESISLAVLSVSSEETAPEIDAMPPQHVPRLGSNWSCSCQPTATLDLSRICDLYVSLQQHWILNPLSEARDRTPVLMDAGRAVPPEVWQPHQPPRSRGGPCPSSLRAALRTELPWPWLSEPWVGRATSSTHTALLAMAQRFRQNRSELMTTWTCGSMTGGGGAQPCPWIPGSRCCGRPDRRHCLQLLLQGSARRCWPGASAGSPSCTWRPLSRPLALDRHGGGLPTGV
ncbi:uncharacterized protein LOC100620498 isoform X3 [Sus scrofa]|uniref:uncharacterized protein LOC100620498 isoform X3 n=1 Tax=Sus scrofa TaxID=9823 RepID=UPI000A2B6EE0|nr:uncharacterized protein LOC100620498 isoform X3 [Sus scrofa]